MKSLRIMLSVVLMSLSTVAFAQSNAQKSFDQLKTLAGSWEGTFEGKPLQVSFRVTSMGNALMAPTLTSLASKSADRSEQGTVLGVTQSVASLARAVGPTIAAFLIYSAVAFVGFDHQPHNMSDASILRTFWTAAAIQFVAFLLAIYFARVYGKKYLAAEMAEAA